MKAHIRQERGIQRIGTFWRHRGVVNDQYNLSTKQIGEVKK